VILVIGELKGGRDVHKGMFADLTTKELTKWGWNDDGDFWVQFAVNLSAEEEAAIRLRCATSSLAEETLRRRAEVAMTAMQDYIALPTPTQAQTNQAVKMLCRVVLALTRLVLKRLDSTD
jgi:hypothetical protein